MRNYFRLQQLFAPLHHRHSLLLHSRFFSAAIAASLRPIHPHPDSDSSGSSCDGDADAAEDNSHLVSSFNPKRRRRWLDSALICDKLHGLKNKPCAAFAYFRDCENLGVSHDPSTYAALISVLHSANRKLLLVSLFSNLISLHPHPLLQLSSIFLSLLQSTNGSSLVSFAFDALIKAYSTCKTDPQQAANAFFHLRSLGCIPALSSCNFLLHSLTESTRTAALSATLISLFRHMKTSGIGVDVRSFTILIRFFLSAGQPSEAIRLFGLMQETCVKPDRFTYMTFLSGMYSCKRYDLCYVILQSMLAQGMQVTPLEFNMVISGFCKESRLDEALNLLQIIPNHGVSPDYYAYGHLIRAYCVQGNLLKALDLYEEMTSRGIKPTPHILAHLLQSVCKRGMDNEVLMCYTKLRDSGVALDRVLYNIFINACCRLGLFREAVGLMQDMKDYGLEPDAIHYTCLIAGLCYAGDVVNAYMVFNEMLNLGLKPDTVTYNVLLSGFCNNGFIDTAIDLLEQMMQQGVELNANTYGLLVKGFCKGGRVCEAELLFKSLEHRGLSEKVGQTGQTHLFSSMVAGYLHRGLTENAYGIFLRSSRKGYLIDKFPREWLIRELCNEGKAKLASNLFCVILREHQTVPDLLSYAKLIAAFCQRGDMSGALFWFEDMINRGIHADLFIYTTLMDGYCKAGRLRDACELFVEMRRVGIKPDAVVYSVLLDGHYKNIFKTRWSEIAKEKGKFEIKAKSLRLIQRMVEDGIEPDVACYTTLIYGQCRMGYYNHAEKLFDEMLRKGLRPDVQAYTALMHGYCVSGEMEKAQNLFQQMIDSGLTPDSVALFVLDKGMLDASEKKRASRSKSTQLLTD